jgi:hypothetical protein
MIVQDAPGARLVEVKESEVWFTAPWALGIVPVQVPRPAPMKFWAMARVRMFAGKASVKRMSVSATAFGFVRVNVIVELGAPAVTAIGRNVLARIGERTTFRKPVAVVAVGVWVLVTALVTPDARPTDSRCCWSGETVTVQNSPAAGCSAEIEVDARRRDSGSPRCVQVSVDRRRAGAMFTSESLHCTLARAAAFGLVSVKTIAVVPRTGSCRHKFFLDRRRRKRRRFAVLMARRHRRLGGVTPPSCWGWCRTLE